MALPLAIPSRFRTALKKLAELPDESVQQLADALGSRPDLLGPHVLGRLIASTVGSPPQEAELLATTLLGLSMQANLQAASVSEIAERAATSPEVLLEEGEREVLKRHLGKLLDTEGVSLPAKATLVLLARGNVLTDTRIITDVRGVFGDEPQELLGSLVTHTLELRYYDGHEHGSFFVGVDERDLTALKKAINRAEEKATTLQRMLAKAGVPYLVVEGD